MTRKKPGSCVLNRARSFTWNEDAAACLSGHVKQDDAANGILLYQGMDNAGNEAHIVATSDWPIATVAQETRVCQSQVRRS